MGCPIAFLYLRFVCVRVYLDTGSFLLSASSAASCTRVNCPGDTCPCSTPQAQQPFPSAVAPREVENIEVRILRTPREETQAPWGPTSARGPLPAPPHPPQSAEFAGIRRRLGSCVSTYLLRAGGVVRRGRGRPESCPEPWAAPAPPTYVPRI